MQSDRLFANSARFQGEHDPVSLRVKRERLCNENTVPNR